MRLMAAPKLRGVLDQGTVIGRPGFVVSKKGGDLHIGIRTSDGKGSPEIVHIDQLDVHTEETTDGGQEGPETTQA